MDFQNVQVLSGSLENPTHSSNPPVNINSKCIQSAVQLMLLIHPLTHTNDWLPCKAPTSSSGAIRVRRRHFDIPRVGSNQLPSDCSYLLSHDGHLRLGRVAVMLNAICKLFVLRMELESFGDLFGIYSVAQTNALSLPSS